MRKTVKMNTAPVAMKRLISVVVSGVLAAEAIEEIGTGETATVMTSLDILLC